MCSKSATLLLLTSLHDLFPATANSTQNADEVITEVATLLWYSSSSTPSTLSKPELVASNSPRDILPLPHYERKTMSRGKKKRQSAIITDTPEKVSIRSTSKETGPQPTKIRRTTSAHPTARIVQTLCH